MKILMIIKWLHNSGAPKIFVWLANSLVAQGHHVTVLTYQSTPNDTLHLDERIKYLCYDYSNLGIIGKIKRIRNLVKKTEPDVSISFLLDANVYNIFASYGLRTKSVICERNDPFKPHYYKLKFWKPWFRFADGAVYQLPKVAEYYNNIKGKTAVIPNPVGKNDLQVSRPFMERADEIVTVGRIDIFQKRHDVLIKAFAKFHKEHPSYRLVIYGGGEDKDIRQIKNLINQMEIEDSTILAGFVSDSTERILNAKMFVLSSDFEGIPNALIEAMSVGLPCISTDCRPGGARLLIEDGANGLIVPVGDSNAIVEKMRYLVENPDIADSMGRESIKITERFSESKIIRMWEEYLNSLIS